MLIGAEDLVRIDGAGAAVVANPFLFCRESVVIDVAGLVCAVHFDDVAAAAHFTARYTDLLSIGVSPERHAFAMCDPQWGWLFWSGTAQLFRWPHGSLAAHAVAFLADAVALTAFLRDRDDGIVSLHAGSLGVADGVAAIIGDSNAGKTTTAIACARAAMDLYSDERCLIDAHLRVHPFPRAVNVRASGLQLLVGDVVPGSDPIGRRLRAHGNGDWNDVRISDLIREQGTLEPRPLRAVFLLGGRAGAASIERVPAAHAVRASARWAQGAGSGLEKIARLLRIFQTVPCYRVALGTPDESARLIRNSIARSIPQLEAIA
ncbi:MAG: hypothetical protein ABSH03_08790 [Candidatus Lustribacter sp.]|jgi:hypothetical protein